MTIRRAKDADAPALGELGALLMRVHYSFDRERFIAPGDHPEIGYGRFLRSQMHGDDTVVFVAEDEGVVVGYVYAGIEPLSWKDLRDEAGFIHDIIVRPESRGRGIATALLEAAIDWVRGKGQPRVLLSTADPNANAQRLFERLGFRRTMVEMTKEL